MPASAYRWPSSAWQRLWESWRQSGRALRRGDPMRDPIRCSCISFGAPLPLYTNTSPKSYRTYAYTPRTYG